MKVKGKYGTAILYATQINDNVIEQIEELMNQRFIEKSNVRIMPDCHQGVGCVIGTTINIKDSVVPNLVGVDIGCGMLTINLGKLNINLPKLDEFIHKNIPAGEKIYDTAQEHDVNITEMVCYDKLKHKKRFDCSIGTLGGGNHFIEIDESDDGEKYLVIHTGSRNLGVQVADFYQDLADKLVNHDLEGYYKKRDEILTTYKELGKEREIETALKELKKELEVSKEVIPYELAYLEDNNREDYLHDMKVCQEFAILNRLTIAKRIADYMGWNIDDYFESIHNYISFDDNIVRKGSISAKLGERVIIPINMRDGCIVGTGLGNEDWNYSAPHGAGRSMSRMEALKNINLDEYKDAMKDIYTTSVNEGTKDEAPFVYKSLEEILEHIIPTVKVDKIIKPRYNFKASEEVKPWQVKKES